MYKLFFYSLLFTLFTIGCDSGDEVDRLSMQAVTGKYWYNNRWQGDKTGFSQEDHMIAMKFDRNGTVFRMNCAGREVTCYGSWECEDNVLKLRSQNAEGEYTEELWNLMYTGDERLDVIVANGERHYTSEPDYLKDLTVDAFLVNEYRNNEGHITFLDARIAGKPAMREGSLILDDHTNYTLKNFGPHWGVDRSKIDIELPAQERDVKFYLRIGHSNHVKFMDHIYDTNLPKRLPADFNLQAVNAGGSSTLKVTWEPYTNSDICYRVEILNPDKDPINPYFVSVLQGSNSSTIAINENSAGSVNRMNDLQAGDNFIVRLSAILFEPEVDAINDRYGEGNIQAITYVEKRVIWE